MKYKKNVFLLVKAKFVSSMTISSKNNRCSFHKNTYAVHEVSSTCLNVP